MASPTSKSDTAPAEEACRRQYAVADPNAPQHLVRLTKGADLLADMMGAPSVVPATI
jgi:hypothetical protein